MYTSNSLLCEYLEWDSTFFGLRIGRVFVNLLKPETRDQILEWGRQERIDCLYFLADSNDAETVRLAQEAQFVYVDSRVTLNCALTPSLDRSRPESIRAVRPGDIPVLKRIAQKNHHDSRFYFDGHFRTEDCDRLYETWIEKSCNGYADSVLIAEAGEEPVGYITCDLKPERKGQIGLLGVASERRGAGIGQGLIKASLGWFADQGVERVDVVTQGRNTGAQRAYQKCGFMTASVQLWFHRWFQNEDLSRE